MNALEAPRRAPLLVALAAALVGTECADPDQFLPEDQAGVPKGALDGTVSYAGPLPCTEDGHIVGAALLLVFDERRLPPPDGVGTSAATLAVVSGDTLFAGVRGRLTFNDNKTRWCPADNVPPVTVSATWAASPLEAGTYQVRGFYDLDGNFDPAFSITNLPTRGDIAGGAIDNPAQALAGGVPVYRQITLGEKSKDGALRIPQEGARITGVAVNLGLQLKLDRPMFFPSAVVDETSAMNTDPRSMTMPSDFQLATFSTSDPVATEASFIRLKLGAGVAPEEADTASKTPFNLPTLAPMLGFVYTRQDVNGDGIIDPNSGGAMTPKYEHDHIPESDQIPALFPLAIFTKLRSVSDLLGDSAPAVLIQGLTLFNNLPSTALAPPDLEAQLPEVVVAIRPAALCLPENPKTPGELVVTHQTDKTGNVLIPDEGALKAALEAQFKPRTINISYGCLPEGRYAMNLVYPTGQAWTVPNEAGVCAASEPKTSDGTKCAAPEKTPRARLASQGVVLTVGKPADPAACGALPAACSPQKAAPMASE